MVDRLGRFGERYFSMLCSRAGVTCNPSLEDDTGWDHFIEFPATMLPGKPLDEQPAHRSALVQVKTTRAARPGCRLKLSNALRMAKAPTPFFVVVVAEPLDGGTPRTFGLHIWEPQIARILKAVRVAEQAGRTDLHRQWLTFGPEDLVETDQLLDWIGDRIDSVGRDYAGAKQKIVGSVGYGNDSSSFTVTLDQADLGALSDLMLGIGTSVRVERIVYRTRRFGIEVAEPEVDRAGGTISITPNPRRGTLRLTTADGDTTSWTAEIISARGVGPDDAAWRSRIVAGCLEMLIDGRGQASARTRLDLDEPRSLADLSQFARLLAWRDRGPLSLTVTIEDARVDLGTLELGPGGPVNWPFGVMATAGLERVAGHDGRHDVSLSFSQLGEEAGALEMFGSLVADANMRFEFEPRADTPDRIDGGLAFMTVEVGGWSFAAVAYRPVDDDMMVGAFRRLELRSARLLDARVDPIPAPEQRAWVEAAYQASVERLKDRSSILEFGDLRDVLGGQAPDGMLPAP